MVKEINFVIIIALIKAKTHFFNSLFIKLHNHTEKFHLTLKLYLKIKFICFSIINNILFTISNIDFLIIYFSNEKMFLCSCINPINVLFL